LAGAYGKDCEKEIRKLESELSTEQILGAQLRAREEFQPLVVRAANEEAWARRTAEEAEARRAEERRFAEEMAARPHNARARSFYDWDLPKP